ncbi:MAG: hypothetical protein WC895_04210 [Candidatus Shapirobacteria bacterium]|jgi:hypothetical protein
MKRHINTLASSLVIATLVLVSLISVCKQSLMTCAMDCSSEMTGAVQISVGMNGCDASMSACGAPMQDHMTTFASMYPSATSDASSSSLAIIGITLLAAWVFISTDASVDRERMRTRLRVLRRRLPQANSPNFLVFAFSQGILNSKIFA